jgi:hypothetical protein
MIWIALFLCVVARTDAQTAARNVLVLFGGFQDENADSLNWIEPVIRSRINGQINFFGVALENFTYPENSQKEMQSYLESEAETLRRRYVLIKFDLVIASSPPALLFALQYRDKIFPGVPIVFTQVSDREFAGMSWPETTGLTVPVGLGETIDLALHLHPDTKQIAVIAGWDKYWLGTVRAELLRYGKRVKEIDFIGAPSRDLIDKVAGLPPHTVVLFQLSPSDDQPALGAFDVLSAVANRWPTYSA